MKLSVSQLRRIIKEEVSKAVMQEVLSDSDVQAIEDAIGPLLDKGIPASRIGRELEKLAGKRAGHEEGSGKPGSKLHKAGKTAGADLDEGMGMAEKVLHAGVLATWLAGAADAAAHGDPTAPAIHVLDAMYEIAKDMPEDQEINAATFAKHFGKKLVGMGPEQD